MEHSPWDPEDVEFLLAADGEPVGEIRIEALEARALYKQLVAARCLDHKLAQRRLPMWVSSAGEEATSTCVGALVSAEEWVYPGPRDVGVAIGRGLPFDEIARQALGGAQADHRGRLRAGTIVSHSAGIAPPSAALGMHLPLAAGHAHAAKLSRLGHATIAMFGEGLTTTGVFHETISLAACCELPLVFVCKSQLWPDQAPAEAGLLGDSVADRARSCGVWTRRVDGADPLIVHQTLRHALLRAREGSGPALVETVISPMRQDPPPHRDPVERLRRYLDTRGQWTKTFQDVVEAEFNTAFDKTANALEAAAV
ncbi:MAG: hypothetical protein B7733_00300 [Myxococcales bacterium FL481]|nr:MAG: hypothetical protein B7733_00300 [Myxococcales bacterium FL481]